MASRSTSVKRSVDLATAGPRVSRIRRNPPPAPKAEPLLDRDDREKISITVGIAAIALALVIAVVGIGAYAGWSPGDYHMMFELD